VLALGKGGALETVRQGAEPTGAFFDEPTEESLLEALPVVDRLARDLDPAAIRAWAQRFDSARFAPELSRELERLLRQ
jgi:hypothetical protein